MKHRRTNLCVLAIITSAALPACGGGNGGGSTLSGPVTLPDVAQNPPMDGTAGTSSAGGATPSTVPAVPDVVFTGTPQGTAGGGSGDFNACAGQVVTTERLPPVLQLLVDTSLSMQEPAPGAVADPTTGAVPTKWEETRAALLQALDVLPEEAKVGLIFYPDVAFNFGGGGAGDVCFDEDADVPIATLGPAGAPHRQLLIDALAMQTPDGATPTLDAYIYARDELLAEATMGDRFVALITDGIPTYSRDCGEYVMAGVDPAPIVDEATIAADAGVRTFVIGSPGSEGAKESLSAIARVGGTGTPTCRDTGPELCHFDMTTQTDFGAALSAALEIIAQQVAAGCTYDVPRPTGSDVIDRDRVNVTVTTPTGEASQIGKDPSETDCTAGWNYAPDGNQIMLCDDACEAVKASRSTVALEFGCQTVIQ